HVGLLVPPQHARARFERGGLLEMFGEFGVRLLVIARHRRAVRSSAEEPKTENPAAIAGRRGATGATGACAASNYRASRVEAKLQTVKFERRRLRSASYFNGASPGFVPS